MASLHFHHMGHRMNRIWIVRPHGECPAPHLFGVHEVAVFFQTEGVEPKDKFKARDALIPQVEHPRHHVALAHNPEAERRREALNRAAACLRLGALDEARAALQVEGRGAPDLAARRDVLETLVDLLAGRVRPANAADRVEAVDALAVALEQVGGFGRCVSQRASPLA